MTLPQQCDAVEAWLWEHFTEQEEADRWMYSLRRPHGDDLLTVQAWPLAAAAALRTGELLTTSFDTLTDPVAWSPLGWDNDALLAEMESAARAA